MENNNIFPNGMMIKSPRQGAPEFVKGSISIKKNDFMQWLNSQQDEWVNLDIKVSKQGKMYLAVNTWKPNQNAPQGNKTPNLGNNNGFSSQSTGGFDSINTDFDVSGFGAPTGEDVPF